MMRKIHKTVATFFLVLICSSVQLSAASFSLAIGERTVVVKVPSACKFQQAENDSYKCTFKTKRNKSGGSFNERTEIIVSGVPVSVERVWGFGTKVTANSKIDAAAASTTSLAEASQRYIQSVDHKFLKKNPAMSLINQLDDTNSAVASKNEKFGGSDCRIYSTALALTRANASVEGIERVGARCILWSYSKPRSVSATAVDLLVEVREIDDFNPRGSRKFTGFATKVIRGLKFK